MKISIWQQFSSNHSSDFTVVGEFSSRVEAEHAADQIRSILKEITDWFDQHMDTPEMDEWLNNDNWMEEPSPIEKSIGDHYNIEWGGSIDWHRDAKIEIVLDRLVFMTPGSRPEQAGRPF